MSSTFGCVPKVLLHKYQITVNMYSFIPQINFTAAPSKSAVCANIKHNRYFHLTSNFRSIHSRGKRLYGHVFDMGDTAFSY